MVFPCASLCLLVFQTLSEMFYTEDIEQYEVEVEDDDAEA